ncbi:MAG TPA: phosphate ABC transporter substrate-binding protein PstS [Ilumatobacteraceae bacterium]|nr:phosphate ABC transporter substrate-binding protein PstS [Ilumatobacteraceae bacterium]
MNTTNKRSAIVAGVLSLTLLAAACGSDSDSNSTTTTAASSTTNEATTTSAATSTTAGPSTSADQTSSSAAVPSTDAGTEFDYAALQGTLVGSGATFPKAFYDEAIAYLADIAPDLTVEYGGGGSGKGRSDLQEQVVNFAGTDSTVKAEDLEKFKGGEFVYIPTVIAPITVSYNVPGVDELHLTPATIAKIFQLEVTTWNDPAIAADNPDADLPDTAIVVARRADGSGTTDNFSKFLNAAVGPDATGEWTLGSGSELEWPAGTQAGDGNSGVAQIIKSTEGAIGYVDLSDAVANGFTFAAVQNKAGEFVLPTIEAATAAAAGATIKDDLTFFVGWADGAEAYPIAAQTWIIAYTTQDDAEAAENLRGFLTYLLTEGQEWAPEVDFAPLPEQLRQQALENVAKIGA